MVLIGEVLDQAWRRLLGTVDPGAVSNPRLFAILVIGVLGFVGGRLVAEVVRTILQMTSIDDMAVKSDVQAFLRRLNYRGALSDFVADLVRLGIYLLAIFAIFNLFGFTFLADYSDTIVVWSSRGFIAALVLLLGIFISTYLEHITVRLFRAGRLSGRADATEAEIPVYVIAGRAMRYVGLVISLIIALALIGVDLMLINILIILFGVAIVAVLAFGSRDLARNIAISIYFQLSRVFRGGETIRVGEYEGEIVGVRPLYTKLRSDGRTYYVPNTELVGEVVERKGE